MTEKDPVTNVYGHAAPPPPVLLRSQSPSRVEQATIRVRNTLRECRELSLEMKLVLSILEEALKQEGML
jgi:hypothetical protein